MANGSNQNIESHLEFEANPGEIYSLNGGMEMIGFQSKGSEWKGFFNKEATISNDHFYHEALMVNNRPLFTADDPSALRFVFPCQHNERPSQGLSLSLSSSNPSTIGLQCFELRHHDDDLRFGPSTSSIPHHHIRNSRYLGPAQELLNEFCNIGMKASEQKMSQSQDDTRRQSFYSLDLVELQRRKFKLFQMLEEVDTRYRHYCDQMKCVESSFESVSGNGAATIYSALVSKDISRHFRRIRDGIVSQIKATRKAMGEKPGSAKGETPRLRLIDQTLRQQRAVEQMSMMESHPWRPQRGLPERSVSILRAWLFEHFLHPYPSDVDKHILARQTCLSRSQVSNWFINARVRLWKPMVEEIYLKEQEDNVDEIESTDKKPTQDELVRIESECLSSIVNDGKRKKGQGVVEGNYGSYGSAMELNFSSYSRSQVSLTLGLQQQDLGLQGSVFYPPREEEEQHHMETCPTVQYSLLDSESQNLPHRNLIGAQLLHDLAGCQVE